jgi:hypothetical protein
MTVWPRAVRLSPQHDAASTPPTTERNWRELNAAGSRELSTVAKCANALTVRARCTELVLQSGV